jgi:hypothetical protein
MHPYDRAVGSDGRSEENAHPGESAASGAAYHPRPTLNSGVRRRRADRAFYMRLAGAIRQNERALERLRR